MVKIKLPDGSTVRLDDDVAVIALYGSACNADGPQVAADITRLRVIGRDAMRAELVSGVESDASVCGTWDDYLDTLAVYATRVPCYAACADDSIVTEYGRGAGASAARQHGLFLTHDQLGSLGDDEVDALRNALGGARVEVDESGALFSSTAHEELL